MGFFAKSEHARSKAIEWSGRDAEFVKRAGFAIMAWYGFANKHAGNEIFEEFLGIIEREAADNRLYVRKAANWALRNIGKRNSDLRDSAIVVAHRILRLNDKSAKWLASHALKAIQNPNAKCLDYPRETYPKGVGVVK
jgi:3-methyladenine DNA glycosylase AlkD